MDTNTDAPSSQVITQTKSETTSTIAGQDMAATDSAFFGVSIRAWVTIIVTLTLCAMTLLQFKVVEPFYSASLFVLGFFFGQKTPTK